MNIKQAAIAIILILSIAMLGGCLGARGKTCSVQVSQNEGLVVKRIQPGYYTIPVNDLVSVYMDVQNRGNAPATDVSATLWAHSGLRLNVLEDDDGKVITNFDEEGTILAGTLDPPRLDICSEGDVYTFTWNLHAGCDPVETILAVYLGFDYTSFGYAKIPMASREEYERTQGELKAKSENFPSAGPLQIKIESIQLEPVLIGEGLKTFSVRVMFSNIGSGLVGPKGVGEVSETRLTLSGPCKFTKRNIEFKGNPTGGKLESNPKDPTDPDKVLIWSDKPVPTVVLKSGSQDLLKIAYLEYPEKLDINDFVEDVCRIEVSAKYRYTNVESPSKKMGVYGSPSQIQDCLSYSPEDWESGAN